MEKHKELPSTNLPLYKIEQSINPFIMVEISLVLMHTTRTDMANSIDDTDITHKTKCPIIADTVNFDSKNLWLIPIPLPRFQTFLLLPCTSTFWAHLKRNSQITALIINKFSDSMHN